MKNSICLFTVIYPGCEPWLPRFFESVIGQTRDDFDLMILNDGLAGAEHVIPVAPNRLQLLPASGTIAKVRQQGIDLLIESDYEKIIFADADDYFSENRIEKAVEALAEADIYVNDLTAVDDAGNVIKEHYFTGRLGKKKEIDLEMILDKNIMGLGNTSVRSSALEPVEIPADTIAADWLIFTKLMLTGRKAIFNNDSVTYYRQHEQNTAGFKTLRPDRILRSLKVQEQQASYFAPQSEIHRERLKKIYLLKQYLGESDKHLDNYLETIEDLLPEQPFWWEEIKTLDEINTDL